VPQGDELFLRLAASSDFATAVPEAFMMQRGLVPEAALEHWTAALNHSNEDNHNRDYQQNVDKATCMVTQKSNGPGYNKYHRD